MFQQHPNVFIFDTETRASVRKVQFRWRWTETQCHETAFFQFMLALLIKPTLKTETTLINYLPFLECWLNMTLPHLPAS